MPYDLAPARRLFDSGAYFQCHELVESAWMAAAGAEKTFLQGVIQAAAAYHKLAQGGRPGYEYLLGRARENLAQAPRERRAWAEAFAAELGKPSPRMPPL